MGCLILANTHAGLVSAATVGSLQVVEPCDPLLSIMAESSNTTMGPWGIFTEPPTAELIQDCVQNSALLVRDGTQFFLATRSEFPVVKVMQTAGPIELTSGFRNFAVESSVNVLDCQNNWLDVRELPGPEVLPVAATMVYYRCWNLMSAGEAQGGTSHTWFFNSSTHVPCTVRSTPPGTSCCANVVVAINTAFNTRVRVVRLHTPRHY